MFRFFWDNQKFNVIQYGKGVYHNDMTRHAHSASSYELHYIESGNGELITDNGAFKVSKGDFFITGPNIYHKQNTDKNNNLEEIHIYMQLEGKQAAGGISEILFSNPFVRFRSDDLELYFKKIIEEKNDKKVGYETVVSGYIQIILTEAVRLLIPGLKDDCKEFADLNNKRFLLIEQAFIASPKDLTIKKLSDDIGLSERQTQRLLKEFYGSTFTQLQKEALK